jgi:hypothetical protein
LGPLVINLEPSIHGSSIQGDSNNMLELHWHLAGEPSSPPAQQGPPPASSSQTSPLCPPFQRFSWMNCRNPQEYITLYTWNGEREGKEFMALIQWMYLRAGFLIGLMDSLRSCVDGRKII